MSQRRHLEEDIVHCLQESEAAAQQRHTEVMAQLKSDATCWSDPKQTPLRGRGAEVPESDRGGQAAAPPGDVGSAEIVLCLEMLMSQLLYNSDDIINPVHQYL